MAEESVDYLKGKIAGLELLSKMFSELVIAAGGFDTSNELNARMRLTANIGKLADEANTLPFPNDLFRTGFNHALAEFSRKLLD